MGNTGSPHAPRWARLTRGRLAPLDPLPDEPTRGLSKSLTRLDLLVIGVAQIIGAGIFIISGVGIKIAGPGIILSFLVAGLACTLAALCYAELASMMPRAGSAYIAYAIFGEMPCIPPAKTLLPLNCCLKGSNSLFRRKFLLK